MWLIEECCRALPDAHLSDYETDTKMGHPDLCLLFEKWCYVGEDVGGYDLVACGGGVGSVALHHSFYAEDVLEEEWEQGDVVFVADDGVGVIELFDVVGAVVGW